MASGSARPNDQTTSAVLQRTRAERATDGASGLTASALAFAVRSHDGRLRESDGAHFIEHPLEVARLLRDAGCSEVVVAAGLLHDVIEDGDVVPAELAARFGPAVADLVRAVTEDGCVASYRQRKLVLREQVRSAGGAAALLFAADKIAKVRELPEAVRRDQERFGSAPAQSRARRRLEHYHDMRLEHYQQSLGMLERVAPGHPLVQRLASELDACRCRRTEGPA